MKQVSRNFEFCHTISTELDKLETNIATLFKSGDVNATDFYGRTALMYIVLGPDIFCHEVMPGRERLAKLLLDNGANPLIKDQFGATALDYFKKYAGEDHPTIELLEKIIAEKFETNKTMPVSPLGSKSESVAKLVLNLGSPVFGSEKKSNESVDALPLHNFF
jgi:hypothetical protein